MKEALRNPKREVFEIIFMKGETPSFVDEFSKIRPSTPVHFLEKETFLRLCPEGSVHQGCIVKVAPLAPPYLETHLQEGCPVVILDQVNDPQNIGSILRVCAALSYKVLILQEKNSPLLEGNLAKVASGALEHVDVYYVPNIAQTIKDLQAQNYWCYGLDERGDGTLGESDLVSPAAFVFGAEGKGLRRLTKERCDELLRLRTSSKFPTLNVSSTVSIVLAAGLSMTRNS